MQIFPTCTMSLHSVLHSVVVHFRVHIVMWCQETARTSTASALFQACWSSAVQCSISSAGIQPDVHVHVCIYKPEWL